GPAAGVRLEGGVDRRPEVAVLQRHAHRPARPRLAGPAAKSALLVAAKSMSTRSRSRANTSGGRRPAHASGSPDPASAFASAEACESQVASTYGSNSRVSAASVRKCLDRKSVV